jgi:hypothetical protein
LGEKSEERVQKMIHVDKEWTKEACAIEMRRKQCTRRKRKKHVGKKGKST